MIESKNMIPILFLFLLIVSGCGQKTKVDKEAPSCNSGTVEGHIAENNGKAVSEKSVDGSETDCKLAFEMLREFYTLYIAENCKAGDFDVTAVRNIKNKYVTDKLLMKLDEAMLDYDPFLNAQDCDESWIKTLEITHIPNSDDIYQISYRYNNEHEQRITLFLIKKEGRYMIDDIMGVEDTTGSSQSNVDESALDDPYIGESD